MVVGVDMVLSEHIGSNRMKKIMKKNPPALEARRGVIPCSRRRGDLIIVVPRCPSLSPVVVGESGDVAA